MPSQLYTNENITFICARNFTYAGEQYTLGEEWDRDLHPGELDKLVRTRYLYPVVDSTEQKPRHWHHHIHIREDIEKKLGIFKDEEDDSLGGENLYNKPEQLGLDQPSVVPGAFDEWEETADNALALHQKADAAIKAQRVLDQENESEEAELTSDDEEPEETSSGESLSEPVESDDGEVIIGDLSQPEEETEDEVVLGDLYDPAVHTVADVNEYLDGDITPEEHDRVIAAERIGKNRKGIVGDG